MVRRHGWVGLLLTASLWIAATGCGSDDTGSPAATVPPEDTPAESSPVAETVAETVAEPVAEPANSEPANSEPAGTDPASTTTPDEAAEPTDTDPCDALANVDVDGLLGEPAGAQESELVDFGAMCTVAASQPDSRGTVSLSMSNNAAQANYENARELFGVDAEVTGLGDEAFVSGSMLVVLDGSELVSIQAIRWSDLGIEGVTQAELEAAMREVLASLGGGASTPTETTPGQVTADGLACTLLADVDIEALIGEPVAGLVDEGDGSTDECVAELENRDSTALVSLTIIDERAAERLAESKEIFGVDSTVDGLGDEAFHSGPVLAVLDGDRAVLLWIMGDIMLGANIDDAELEAVMAQVLTGIG